MCIFVFVRNVWVELRFLGICNCFWMKWSGIMVSGW